MNRASDILTTLATRFAWPLRLVVGCTDGSWMFRDRSTAWLAAPEVRRQLPLPHRLFARWCTLRLPPLPGSELLFHLAAACLPARDSGLRGIELPGGTLHLDLRDPRSLRVPSDLITATARLSPFLGPGDTLIDVGANHGAFSLAAARLVGPSGRLVAFEPQPRLAEAIRRSLSDWAACRWEVHPVACGDHHAAVDLYVPKASSGAAGMHRRFSGRLVHRTVRVPLRTLDSLIPDELPTGRVVMKIDVEGSEPAVLGGASRLIDMVKPVILLEINPRAMRAAGTTTTSLGKVLRSLGYDRYLTHDPDARPAEVSGELPAGDIVLLPPATREDGIERSS